MIKRILFLLVVSLMVCPRTFAQSITDLFLALPDRVVMDLTRAERERILSYSLDNVSHDDAMNDLQKAGNIYAFSTLNKKNGYLEMIGGFEGVFQMCLWKLDKRTQLVAVYKESCGPGCSVDYLEFYKAEGEKLTAIPKEDVLPDIEPLFYPSNLDKTKAMLAREGIDNNLLFELPSKGKDMIVYFGGDDTIDSYKKYGIKGNRLTLKWANGRFDVGEMKWVE